MKKFACSLAILIFYSTLYAQLEQDTDTSHMRLASCQFPVSDQISKNADWIIRQMVEAADSGARVVHFPECALSGYPGVDMPSLEGFDWTALRVWSDSIMKLADALDIWVILGSIHELGEKFKPMNSLYVINPDGKIGGSFEVDRPGILISDVHLSDKFYDASGKYRENAMEGKLSSGDSPDDPRYSNRKSL